MSSKREMVDTKFNIVPDHVTRAFTWRDSWKQFLEILDLAWLMFLNAILYFLMFPISLVFVGKLGTLYLDAVGLGNTLFNVFGILVFTGLMTGADTTMSQSYGTANKHMVGVYAQRGFLVFGLAVMICIAVQLNAEFLLTLVGQNREVARLSGMYVSILCMGLPLYGVWTLNTRYFRIQHIVWINFISLALMTSVNLLLHYVLISVLGYGIQASAVAQLCAYASAFICISIMTPLQRKVVRKTWPGLSRLAWHDWGPFFRISFAGLFIVCLQWWGLEICTLLAGTLGKVELAAQAIIFQVNYFIYVVPASIGISCNVIIGQHVGGNRPAWGKLCMRLGWGLTWSISAIAIILLLSLRYELPKIFSDEEEVINLTSETLPYLALYHAFDSTVSSSLGMCRGIARQKMGALVSLIGIYGIGTPAAILLTFYADIGLKGLWIGPALGLAFETVTLLVLLSRTNWQKECEAAQKRAGIDPNKHKEEETVIEDDETSELISDSRPRRQTFGSEAMSSQKDLSVLRTGAPLSTSQLF